MLLLIAAISVGRAVLHSAGNEPASIGSGRPSTGGERPSGRTPCRASVAARPSSTPRLRSALWRSGFEGDRSDLGEWSWWGQNDPTYVGISVVDPLAERPCVPRRQGGRVARFEVTPANAAQGRINSKLYQYFHGGSGGKRDWSPSDVGGTYRASFWLPRRTSLDYDGSVNAFQFKDQAWSSAAKTSEDSTATWEVSFRSAAMMRIGGVRPDAPVAYVRHGGEGTNPPGRYIALPLERWFELRAELYPGNRIEYYLDGRLLRTGTDTEHPVGHYRPNSFNWIFGIGWFSSSPGMMYADDVSYTRHERR